MTTSRSKDNIIYEEFVDVHQERLLVTALALKPDMIPSVQKMLPGVETFKDGAARVVYESILEIYKEGNQQVRGLSIMQRVRIKNGFGMVKDAKLSLTYNEMVPYSNNEIAECAMGILSMHRRGEAHRHNLILNDQLRKGQDDSELAETVFRTYEALTLSGGRQMEKTSKEAVLESLESINEAMRRHQQGGIIGVTTGSAKLDEYTGGWMDDQLIILAGRPGMGKTALALDMALSAARSGVPVGIFSMEMPAKQLINRMAANLSDINQGKIRKGSLNIDEYKQVEHALSEIAKLPLYFYDDTSSKDVRKLESIATEWKRTKGVGLIIIDYIQYLEIKGFTKGYDRVTEVTKAVKTMQRNLKIPIIALAQLSRESEKRADPRPKDSDLKESGQIEQDASIIIGLFNPDYYIRKGIAIYDEMEDDGSGKSTVSFRKHTFCLYLLKNRDGELVRVDRYADLGTNKFSDHDIFSAVQLPDRPAGKLTDFKYMPQPEPNF